MLCLRHEHQNFPSYRLIPVQSYFYTLLLEWLKATKWNGVLPLVTGGGSGGQGSTPFIDILTAGNIAGFAQQENQTNRTSSQ